MDNISYAQVDEITRAELNLDENVCYGIRSTRVELNLHENERNETDNLDENERVTARSDSGTGTKNSDIYVAISKSRSQFIIM